MQTNNNSSLFLPVFPNLANKIGVDESLFLAKIHYWLTKCGREMPGELGLWIYNTLDDWHLQFSCWSMSKLRRVIKSLEKQQLLKTKKFNSHKWNQTKWYSIEPDIAEVFFNKYIGKNSNYTQTTRFVQNEQMNINKQKNNYTNNLSKDNTSSPPIRNKTRKIVKSTDLVEVKKQKPSKTLNYLVKTQEIRLEQKVIAEKMFHIWQEVFKHAEKPISFTLTNKRVICLAELWDAKFSRDENKWHEFVIAINSSKFLMGEKTDFHARIDWLLQEETIKRIEAKEFEIGDRIPDIKRAQEEEEKKERREQLAKLKSIQKEKEQQEKLDRIKECFTKALAEQTGGKLREKLDKQTLINDEKEFVGWLEQEDENWHTAIFQGECRGFNPITKQFKEEFFNKFLISKYLGLTTEANKNIGEGIINYILEGLPEAAIDALCSRGSSLKVAEFKQAKDNFELECSYNVHHYDIMKNIVSFSSKRVLNIEINGIKGQISITHS